MRVFVRRNSPHSFEFFEIPFLLSDIIGELSVLDLWDFWVVFFVSVLSIAYIPRIGC